MTATDPAAALVSDLRGRGVELLADGDRLRYRPRRAVSPAEQALLRRFKPQVLALVGAEPTVAPAGPWARAAAALLSAIGDDEQRADLRYAFEERAGVLEFDAGLPRDEAEARAYQYLARHACALEPAPADERRPADL